VSVCYAPDATSLHLSLLYLPFSPSGFPPSFPSKCPPAAATSGFGSALEEGSPSKLSRRAQHNEERYFVKRCRRYGVNDRMDGRTDERTNERTDRQTDGRTQTPRKDSADIHANKKIRDAAYGSSALQTLRVSGPPPLHLGPFAACARARARVRSLALFLLRFLRLKRNKCVFTLNMKDF